MTVLAIPESQVFLLFAQDLILQFRHMQRQNYRALQGHVNQTHEHTHILSSTQVW